MLRIVSALCAACALAVLVVAPYEVAARPGGAGFGAHSFHPAGRHGSFRRSPSYGYGTGFVSTPYYAPDYVGSDAIERAAALPPEPLRVMDCHRSQQTVTVPSEQGGTREITVTRC
jgi:hypothetical protein